MAVLLSLLLAVSGAAPAAAAVAAPAAPESPTGAAAQGPDPLHSPDVPRVAAVSDAQTLGAGDGLRAPPSSLPADAPLRAPAGEPQPRWTVPVLHGVGVMLGMRVGLSALWPRAYDPSRLGESVRQLGEAYSRPPEFHRGVPLLESDGDPWLLNTVGHGLFGAEMYGRARHCGHSALASLAAAAVASTAWEYSLEALHQRPSAVDLVWTPLAGALLGEGRFRLHRLVRGDGVRVGALRRVLLVVLDPLGEAERGLLGTPC